MHNSVNGTSSCTCAVKSKQPPPYYKPIQHETATLEPIMSCELDTFCQTTTHANKASTYQPFVQTQKRTCRGKMSRACMPEVLKLNKNTCICSGDLSQCACQKGYYWNMGACIACPTGSTTLEDGAVSLTSCTCMPGFVNTQPSNPAACEACGVGFFCNGESHRQACPANHTTEQDTSGNKSHCVCSTGVYLKDGSCTACPAGHFKIDVGNMPCQKCPHGRWSGVVGADTSLVCTACVPALEVTCCVRSSKLLDHSIPNASENMGTYALKAPQGCCAGNALQGGQDHLSKNRANLAQMVRWACFSSSWLTWFPRRASTVSKQISAKLAWVSPLAW